MSFMSGGPWEATEYLTVTPSKEQFWLVWSQLWGCGARGSAVGRGDFQLLILSGLCHIHAEWPWSSNFPLSFNDFICKMRHWSLWLLRGFSCLVRVCFTPLILRKSVWSMMEESDQEVFHLNKGLWGFLCMCLVKEKKCLVRMPLPPFPWSKPAGVRGVRTQFPACVVLGFGSLENTPGDGASWGRQAVWERRRQMQDAVYNLRLRGVQPAQSSLPPLSSSEAVGLLPLPVHPKLPRQHVAFHPTFDFEGWEFLTNML